MLSSASGITRSRSSGRRARARCRRCSGASTSPAATARSPAVTSPRRRPGRDRAAARAGTNSTPPPTPCSPDSMPAAMPMKLNRRDGHEARATRRTAVVASTIANISRTTAAVAAAATFPPGRRRRPAGRRARPPSDGRCRMRPAPGSRRRAISTLRAATFRSPRRRTRGSARTDDRTRPRAEETTGPPPARWPRVVRGIRAY